MHTGRVRLALAATFTADPILPTVRFWMEECGVPADVELAPFDQVAQSLLEPAGLLRSNGAGVNVVLVRFVDWGVSGEQDARDRIDQLADALVSALAAGASPALVVRCPDPPDREATAVSAWEDALRETLAPIAGVHFVSAATVRALYPVEGSYDRSADEAGRIPYTPDYFAALGTIVARRAQGLLRPPYKVLALDCDGTLWGGVCGEMAPDELVLGPSHFAVQRLAVELAQDGWLVCLCSKNQEADVLRVFEARQDMPLTLDRVAAHRVNWAPKSQNLRELADELGVGIDTFVFLDDSPVECAEVRANRPEVLALQLPADLVDVEAFLRHVWAFDRFAITDEDRRRAASYAEEAARRETRARATSFEEFLETLQLRVDIADVGPAEWERAGQLTRRTNQFNATGARTHGNEMAAFADGNGRSVLRVRVEDRFGDYGIVGVAQVAEGPGRLRVEGWWLSCRALGRGVEHAVLREFGRRAERVGASRVEVAYEKTERNEPVRQFLTSVGADHGPAGAALPTAEALRAAVQAADAPVPSNPEAAASGGRAGAPASAAGWMERAAGPLRTPQAIRRAVEEGARRARPDGAGDGVAFVPPQNETERELAEIWRAVLGLDRVGAHDDFFSIGGDSLTGTVALARVRSILGVALPLDALFDDPTLQGLARRVSYARLEQVDPESLRAWLSEESASTGGIAP